MQRAVSLGLDFGTESVRAVLVDETGIERGVAASGFRHGQIVETLPTSGKRLPPDFALQHPQDWIDSAAEAVGKAMSAAGLSPGDVVGIGVDFTSCTMLPALRDGVPLCLADPWRKEKFAWPKLWKHHGAIEPTRRINELAREMKAPWLDRYGGIIGLEWFFPKMLETAEQSPAAFDAAEVWLEAGDWFVWRLVGGPADELPRSTCQAGYKGMWSREDGFPSAEFFRRLHPGLEQAVKEKMPGRFLAPGEKAGGLCAEMAAKLGLKPGIAVSAAIIDAHAGVPGAGAAEPDTLVMVMGTSSCHMLNSTVGKVIPGVAGVVKDGILPGYYGYETGQAAVGDAFEWVRKLVGGPDFSVLSTAAAKLPVGADGVRCVDWFNGCRTPLMDGALTGAFSGLSLGHSPAHVFRAAMEASACGLRWIVDTLRGGGVPVKKYVATGGLPHHNPAFLQICADVLGQPIEVPESKQGPALGAAILGALAAGVFENSRAAIEAMAGSKRQGGAGTKSIEPNSNSAATYESVYRDYRRLADLFAGSSR